MSNFDNHADTSHALGRLIYQGAPGIAFGAMLFAVGVLWLALSVALALFNSDPRAPLIGGLGALLAMVFIVIGVIYLLPRFGSVLYFHEHGVRHVLRRRERVLRYEDVADLRFITQRVYYSGVYMGSPARLTLRSTDPSEKPDVQWTDRMRIHADGIEVRDGTIIMRDGKWVPNLVPWDKIARADFENGQFLLQLVGENMYRVVAPLDSPNFYPGYIYVASHLPADVSMLNQLIAEWGEGRAS